MKPYGEAVLSEQKRYFNYRLSRARMVTEGAFGKLKGRWRILSKKCESHKGTVKKMGLACVVLHNICIDRGDIIPRNIDLTVDPITNKRRPPNEIRDVLQMTNINQRYLRDSPMNAKIIRDCIAKTFLAEKTEYEQKKLKIDPWLMVYFL